MTMHRSRGRTGSAASTPHPENRKAIGFLSNNSADPLENHKANEPEFNVGPSSSHQQNFILMAFRCWADDGLFIVLFDLLSYPPKLKNTTTKNNFIRVGVGPL